MSIFDRLSRNKFHGEASHDGSPLLWPGTPEGFPVRSGRGGAKPLLKDSEYENIPLRLDYDCGWFDLDKEDDLKRFRVVMDHLTSGVWLRVKRTDVPTATGGLRVFLEWAYVSGETKGLPHD